MGGHLIFATSQTYTGNLGGLAGADGLCQAAADAAGLSGSFVALLSTAAIDTNTRVTITGPVSKTTGDVVAVDSTDLWDGEIQLPIGHDENGTAILGNAWTGSHAGGTAAAAQCSDWVTENGNGRRGMVDTTGGGWFGGSPVTCGEEHRLYCIR